MKSIAFKELKPDKPFLFFVPNENNLIEKYEEGLDLNKLFIIKNTGVCSQRDAIAMQNSESDLKNILSDFEKLTELEIRNKHNLSKDGRDWKINFAKSNLFDYKFEQKYFTKIHYRIFDNKMTFYTNKSKGFIAYPRYEVFKHLLKDNICFLMNRSVRGIDYNHVFVSKFIPDLHLFETASASIYGAPLYLYPKKTEQPSLLEEVVRTPNLNMEIVNQIGEQLGMYFNPEEFDGTTTVETNQFTPLNILDYIYAVLHSPTYREKYKEFLKIDFPRVPYPKNQRQFIDLIDLGSQLREIHLLESETVENYITEYPEDGDNIIGKPKFVPSSAVERHLGRVYINDTQYFDNVPEVAWNFYIGGYQPAQKWLKDRKERELSFEDILHYQKIIVALSETDRIMKEIDTIEI